MGCDFFLIFEEIPYCKISKKFLASRFFWNNIPGIFHTPNISFLCCDAFFFGIFHIPISLEESCDGKKMEYSIFHKNQKKVVMVQKLNIEDSPILGT